MAKTYDNNLSGVLFKNAEKEELKNEKDTSKWPDYKGSAEIEGEKYWLSAWIKESQRDNSKFLSISFKKKEEAGGYGASTRDSRPNERRPANNLPPNDDDIPF